MTGNESNGKRPEHELIRMRGEEEGDEMVRGRDLEVIARDRKNLADGIESLKKNTRHLETWRDQITAEAVKGDAENFKEDVTRLTELISLGIARISGVLGPFEGEYMGVEDPSEQMLVFQEIYKDLYQALTHPGNNPTSIITEINRTLARLEELGQK